MNLLSSIIFALFILHFFVIADSRKSRTAAHLALLNSKLCLEVKGAKDENGTKIQLAPCEGGKNGHQRWEYTAKGQIVSLFSGKCIDAVLSTGESADIQLWDCIGGDFPPKNQVWEFAEGLIKSRFDQRCLQVHGSAKMGSNIMLFKCNQEDQLQQYEIRDGVASDGVTRTLGGCTCQHMWSINGKTFVYPNNCVNPNGTDRSNWCFTLPNENCVGKSGSVHWDECSPSPSKHEEKMKRPVGVTTQKINSDNYHRGDAFARGVSRGSSLKTRKVGVTTQIIVNQSLASVPHPSIVPQKNNKVTVVKSNSRQPLCKHGYISSSRCICDEGFSGEFCDDCSNRYFNYPVCKKKIQCAQEGCRSGSCDFSTGECICPFNFAGKQCERCALGYRGNNCAPIIISEDSSWFSVQFMFTLLLLFVATFVAIFFCQVQ
eukprot:g1875.t1